MKKIKNNEATAVASSRSRSGNSKAVPRLKAGQAHQERFLNFLINALGDNKDVSISIDGNKPKSIKEIKKNFN